MGKLDTFANMANAYLSSDQAPKSIRFTQSEALQDSVEGLAALAEVDYYEVTDKQEDTYKHTADYEALLKDRLHYGEHLKPFDELANVFAKKLHDGISNLKQIKRTVTQLSTEVMQNYKDQVAADPVLTAFIGEEDLSKLQLPAVDWKLLNDISERGTVIKIHDKIGHQPEDAITASVLSLAINTLPGVVDHRTCEPVALRPEKVDRIVDNVYSAVRNKGCTRQDVQDVVRASIFLTPLHLRRAANSITALAELKNCDTINQVMQLAKLNNLVLPYITDEVTDVAAAARKKINHNLDLLKEIYDLAAYVAIYLRNEVWKDAILVPGPMINPDNVEAFFSQGGSVGALVQYYNYAYKATGVPTSGLSLKFTLESLGQATAEYKLEAARTAAQCVARKQAYLRSAFINVGLNYLNQHRERFSPAFQVANLPEFVNATYDGVLPDTPLENRLYDLILNSCHINRIERNLYHRLSKAYLEQAKSMEMLTEEVCRHIDVKVYADMVAEYLVDKRIVIAEW